MPPAKERRFKGDGKCENHYVGLCGQPVAPGLNKCRAHANRRPRKPMAWLRYWFPASATKVGRGD